MLGFALVADEHFSESRQIHFPKTKKRRIRKKWAKRPENYRRFATNKVLIVGRVIRAHPETLRKLTAALEGARSDTGEFDIVQMPEPPSFLDMMKSEVLAFADRQTDKLVRDVFKREMYMPVIKPPSYLLRSVAF